MRRHYTINSSICHFHENAHGILHEVDDLLNLISLPISTRKILIDNWHGKLLSLPAPDTSMRNKPSEQYLLITENLLFAFLSEAQAKHPERTLIDVKALFSKIMQERLDAIVENDTPYQTHAEPGARSAMLKAARATYLTAYYHMNRYEKQGVLRTASVSEWHHIQTLLPTKTQAITERHLYALLTLIAPIWPEDRASSTKTMAEQNVHLTLCILIEIIKSDRISKTEKPKFFLAAIGEIGQSHAKNETNKRDQPNP